MGNQSKNALARHVMVSFHFGFMRLLLRFAATVLTAFAVFSSMASAEEVVQFDVAKILNARPVSVMAGGKLVPWTKGVDGAGKADGFMTTSAAVFNRDGQSHALPNDGKFPANPDHPEVALHFTDDEAVLPQACSLEGESVFELSIPANRYRQVFLFFTSAEGPSELKITMNYEGDRNDERSVAVPDYYNDAVPGDRNIFSLATELSKWNAEGRMAEADHHFIHGLRLNPDGERALKKITVRKTAPGYLVFWGATGILEAQ